MSSLKKREIKDLIDKSYKYRVTILKMMKLDEVHIGGAFSCIDILTVLYNKILNNNPKDPKWDKRDRFILSAGHKGIALYVVLQDLGYFDEEILWTWGSLGSRISMHPDEKTLPGIEFPTGALGHGLALAGGLAITAKLDKKTHKVFALLGDGECAEGTVWEAAMSAAHFKLDNLFAIVDRNRLQVNGQTSDVMDSSLLEEKFKSFGWETRVINGHKMNEIYKALMDMPFNVGKPSCVIADTVKCKGIETWENNMLSHHCHWNAEKVDEAINLLKSAKRKEIAGLE